MLRAAHVTKRFPGGIEALSDASPEVPTGETPALVGERGSGKTTLLQAFNRTIGLAALALGLGILIAVPAALLMGVDLLLGRLERLVRRRGLEAG